MKTNVVYSFGSYLLSSFQTGTKVRWAEVGGLPIWLSNPNLQALLMADSGASSKSILVIILDLCSHIAVKTKGD